MCFHWSTIEIYCLILELGYFALDGPSPYAGANVFVLMLLCASHHNSQYSILGPDLIWIIWV